MYDHKYLFSAIISFPQSGRYTLQHTHTQRCTVHTNTTALWSDLKVQCSTVCSHSGGEEESRWTLILLRSHSYANIWAVMDKFLSLFFFFIICKLPNISKPDVRRSVHRHKSTEIYFSRRCARAYELHVKLTICISTATTNSRQLFCKY